MKNHDTINGERNVDTFEKVIQCDQLIYMN